MIDSINNSKTFGAQVVSKTLDYVNQNQNNSNVSAKMKMTYDTTKEVVGGVVESANKTQELVNQVTNSGNNNQPNSIASSVKGDLVNLVV